MMSEEHRCFMGYVIEEPENAEETFYALALPEFTIYGHTVDWYTKRDYPEDLAITENGRKQGIEFACWHSEVESRGEIGSNAVDGLRKITREQFLEAWDAGWPKLPPALNAPAVSIYTMEEDGSIEKVWDSLRGDV
jgi:hypothetical protein